MIKRVFLSFLVLLFIGGGTLLIISYGKGYRFNPKEKSLTPTGILSASSYPQNASILVDNKLLAATNASITLNPGWYDIKITKEGYQSWEKKIRIQGEVVSTIDVLLLPTNPSFKTLTTTGIHTPELSPSGTRVAYIFLESDATPSATTKIKEGIYLLDLKSGTLGGRSEARPLFTPTLSGYDFKNVKLSWSPDEKQLMATFSQTVGKKTTISNVYLIDVDNNSIPPIDISTTYTDQIRTWDALKLEKTDLDFSSIPATLSSVLRNTTDNLRFSPDESKIYYHATASATLSPIIIPPIIGSNPTAEDRSITPGKNYVFDLKEDKNYFIASDPKAPGDSSVTGWYSDSKHLILIEKGTIYFVDFDGTNKRSVYSGPFIDSIVYPWASGGQIVVLTNFNNPNSPPNFYEIDLR